MRRVIALTVVGLEIALSGAPARAESARERAQRLEKTLASDKDPGARAAAARELGDLGARDAVPALAAALKDPDKETRELALAPLLRLGFEDKDSRAVLLGALQGGKPDIRRAIFAGLRDSGFRGSEPWAREALLKALDDPAEDIVLTAAGWLSSSQNSEAACVCQMQKLRAGATPRLRATAARSLGLMHRCANRTGPALGQALLEEPDVEVRLAVVSVVVNVADEDGIFMLIRTIQSDASARVRAAACRALPGFDALSRMGPSAYQQVLAALAAASHDTDESVRDAADSAARALKAVL